MKERDEIDRDEDEDLNHDDEHDDEMKEAEESSDESRPGRSGTLSFIAGLVLGALVGAGAALLMAPEPGSVTRRRLKKLVRRVRSDARDRLGDWRDDVKTELKRRRRQIREQIER